MTCKNLHDGVRRKCNVCGDDVKGISSNVRVTMAKIRFLTFGFGGVWEITIWTCWDQVSQMWGIFFPTFGPKFGPYVKITICTLLAFARNEVGY